MLVLRFVEWGGWREVLLLLLKPGREGVEDGILGREEGILAVLYRAMLGCPLLVSLRVARAQRRLLQ